MKRKYTVTVAGIALNLLSEDSPEYVLGLAKAVDDRINAAREGKRNISIIEAVLFSDIDLLDENVRYAQKITALREENEALKKQLSAALKAGEKTELKA